MSISDLDALKRITAQRYADEEYKDYDIISSGILVQ